MAAKYARFGHVLALALPLSVQINDKYSFPETLFMTYLSSVIMKLSCWKEREKLSNNLFKDGFTDSESYFFEMRIVKEILVFYRFKLKLVTLQTKFLKYNRIFLTATVNGFEYGKTRLIRSWVF